MNEAPTMRCERCGAYLPFDPRDFSVNCPACHAETKVGAEARRNAEQYRSTVQDEKRRADLALSLARSYQQGPGVGLHAGVVEPRVSAPCSSCGGQVSFGQDDLSTRCPFCGATVSAPARARAALVESAEATALQAESKSARAQRDLVRKSFPHEGRTNTLLWAAMIGAGAVIAVLGAVDLATSDAGDVATGATLIGIGGAALLGTLVTWSIVSAPRRAIERGLGALSPIVRGRLSNRGLAPVLDWLDANWVGDNPGIVGFSNPGRGCWVLSGSWRDAPVLIAITDTWFEKRLDLLVTRRRASADERARSVLAGSGFTVTAGALGVHAWRKSSDLAILGGDGARVLLDALIAS